MAKKDLVPRRGRVSKFEPYDAEILTMLEAGMQITEVTEQLQGHFDDVVDYKAVYDHIRSKGFRVKRKKYTGLKEHPPRCKECSQCVRYDNFSKTGNVLICLPAGREIRESTRTSPLWCKLR